MPKFIAIDLGTGNVKATIRTTGRKEEGTERIMEPIVGPDEASLGAQLEALQSMLTNNPGIVEAGATVAVAVSGRHIAVHRITLPFTDAKQIEQTLPFAVEDAVPFDLDEMNLSWRILSQDEQTEAMVSMGLLDVLKSTVDGLSQVQLQPKFMHTDKELLARWSLGIDEEGATAVIDIGHQTSVISVAQDGVLLDSRVIDIAGRSFTAAIQSGLGCSWRNATRLKEGLPAIPDTDETAIEALAISEDPEPVTADIENETTDPDAPEPVTFTPWDSLPEPGLANLPAPIQKELKALVQRLLSEVRATLIGLEDSLGTEINTVVLAGGGARLTGLAQALHNDLGVPVHWPTGHDMATVPCEFALTDALIDAIDAEPVFLATNLRSGALRFRGGFSAFASALTYGTLLMGFFSIAMVGMYAYQSWGLSSQRSQTDEMITTALTAAVPESNSMVESDAMRAFSSLIKAEKDMAKALSADAVPPATDIQLTIAEVLPPPDQLKIDVTQLTYTTEVLEFEAEVPNFAGEKVQAAMRTRARLAGCTASDERKKRDKVQFKMSCEFGADPKSGG